MERDYNDMQYKLIVATQYPLPPFSLVIRTPIFFSNLFALKPMSTKANFGSVEHCAVSQLLYHNPRALHIDDTCVDTPLGGPLAGHFNGLWWFLLIYKCLEEKESGLCKGRVIPWKAHQEGRFLSQLVQRWTVIINLPGLKRLLVTQTQGQQT